MLALEPADILDLWEAGRGQPPAARALVLLERACPWSDRDTLARLPLGERDRLLLRLRCRTIGERLEAISTCPACDEAMEFGLGTEELLGAPSRGDDSAEDTAPDGAVSGGPTRQSAGGSARSTPSGEPPPALESETAAGAGTSGTVAMTVAGFDLRFRPIDTTDLLAAAGSPDADAARATLVERCVLDARREGAAVAAADLPPEVLSTVAGRLTEGDAHLEILVDLTCPGCGHAWCADLDLAGFFWEEIQARALELLDQVDVLARAYGWSEAEILGLGPERRRLYVERVV